MTVSVMLVTQQTLSIPITTVSTAWLKVAMVSCIIGIMHVPTVAQKERKFKIGAPEIVQAVGDNDITYERKQLLPLIA